MKVWASAHDLAAILHVPVGTIYRWASEHHWPRHVRPVRYDLDAAVQTAERHARVERSLTR